MPISSNPISASLYSNTSYTSPISERLTSGSRINSAADDPAGLAIVNAMSSQIMAQNTGVQNAVTGISMLQTVDGAAGSITASLQRMSELSIQAQNGILNPSQRNMINTEFQQLMEEVNRVSNSTQFNGQNLLNGDVSSINIQLGDTGTDVNMANLTTDALGITGLNVSDPTSAAAALEGLYTAIDSLSSVRGQFGAQQNGLESSVQVMQEASINTMGSRSQINDTDYARSISDMMRARTLQDAEIAMQAQSNQNRGAVLQLLAGATTGN